MFVLSYVLPPTDGAAYGKAEVYEAVTEQQAADVAGNLLSLRDVPTLAARQFCNDNLAHADIGTDVKHAGTGITFRIDTEDNAPHPCPCCGRLVLLSDHPYADAEDAYCTGCFTWDRNVTACLPKNTAHANPWTTDPTGARYYMEVTIDRGDETDTDYRYATDKPEGHRQLWDDEDNALIAWPELPSRIISVTITEINKEN